MLLKTILIGALFTYRSLAASVGMPHNSELGIINREDDSSFNNTVFEFHKKVPKCSRKTKGTCIVHRKGNINVGFAGRTVNYGTFNPVDAIEEMHKKCHGGGCRDMKFHKPTKIVYKGQEIKAVATFSATGSFDASNRNALFDALKRVTKKTVKSTRVRGLDSLGEQRIYEQHRHASEFRVTIPVHGRGKVSPNVQLSIAVHAENDAEDGFCGTFFSFASAAASAVSAVGGSSFLLLALVCDF